MFKVLGLCGMVASFGLMGIMQTLKLKKRIYCLKGYAEALLQIKTGISYLREPLTNILKRLNCGDDLRLKCFKDELVYEISEKDGEINDLWPKIIKESYKGSSLSREDIEILCYPATFLGQSDFENQQYHFDYLEEKLHTLIERAEKEYIKKSPLYNKLGFFIGALAAIVFI